MTGTVLSWNLYKAHLLNYTGKKNVIPTQHTLRRCKVLYEGSFPQAQTRTPISQTVTYWSYRDVLTCVSDSLLKVDKLIVPKILQSQKVHETHLGIVRCKSRARRVLLWPGMSAQREDCCTLPGVWRTLQSKSKGAIGSSGISRSTLGEGSEQIFLSWTATTTWPWLTVSESGLTYTSWITRQPRTSSPLSKVRSPDTEFQINDHRQRTSGCFCCICSIHDWLWYVTHNNQSLLSTSKQANRKNCKDCQTLADEGDRSTQSAA